MPDIRLARIRSQCPDQSVPVIGHQNIPTQQKPQPLSRGMHDVEDQGIFAIAESPDPRPKIDVDKENAVGQAQAVNVRHSVSIAPRTYTSRGRAHGQKSTDRGYPLVRAGSLPGSGNLRRLSRHTVTNKTIQAADLQ